MDRMDLLERSFPGRRAELKRIILRTALASFNRQGIEATTIDMIKESCQTSVGAIYHHFGNKEGLIAALFFAALDDLATLRDRYLAQAKTAQEGVQALVYSYVDWVDSQPDYARFQFAARFSVANGPFKEELATRNNSRNKTLQSWLSEVSHQKELKRLPLELMPSLIIGAAENYSRAWLAGRVNNSPKTYRTELAEAAWRGICTSPQQE